MLELNRSPSFFERLENQVQLKVKYLEQSPPLSSPPAKEMRPSLEYRLGVLKFCVRSPQANRLPATLKSRPGIAPEYIGEFS